MEQNQDLKPISLLYQSFDDCLQLNLQMQKKTLWLTSWMMSFLFQTTWEALLPHIKKIEEDPEWKEQVERIDCCVVFQGRFRQVKGRESYYNLAMVIALCREVKSIYSEEFCLWATESLKKMLDD